jgi:ribosomal protein S12 methylthiotransferase accessory factor YcaO
MPTRETMEFIEFHISKPFLKPPIQDAPRIAVCHGTLNLPDTGPITVAGRGVADNAALAQLIAEAEAVERIATHLNPIARLTWRSTPNPLSKEHVGTQSHEWWAQGRSITTDKLDWAPLHFLLLPSRVRPNGKIQARCSGGVAAHTNETLATFNALKESIECATLFQVWKSFLSIVSNPVGIDVPDGPLAPILDQMGYQTRQYCFSSKEYTVAVAFLIAHDQSGAVPSLISGSSCDAEPKQAMNSALSEAFAQLVNAAELHLAGADMDRLAKQDHRCKFWRPANAARLIEIIRSSMHEGVRCAVSEELNTEQALVFERRSINTASRWIVKHVLLPSHRHIEPDTIGPYELPPPF